MADGFDNWTGREDELLALMLEGQRQDRQALRARGLAIPPWYDLETQIQKDWMRIVAAVADSGGAMEADYSFFQNLLGFKALNNTKTSVNGAIRAGLLENRDGTLHMTEWGMDVLNEIECGADLSEAA